MDEPTGTINPAALNAPSKHPPTHSFLLRSIITLREKALPRGVAFSRPQYLASCLPVLMGTVPWQSRLRCNRRSLHAEPSAVSRLTVTVTIKKHLVVRTHTVG